MISWYCHTVFRQMKKRKKERKRKRKQKDITGCARHSILQGSIQQNNAVINYHDLRNKEKQVF